MLSQYLQDALFSAIAAIGFAAISNPPKRAFLFCAIIAAIGHSTRFLLMHTDLLGLHIVTSTAISAFLIGLLAVAMAPVSKVPPETYLFPALLPMIPGIYAYRTVEALLMCLFHQNEEIYNHYFYLFTFNALTCFFILLAMTLGAVIPIFIFKKISFQSTR